MFCKLRYILGFVISLLIFLSANSYVLGQTVTDTPTPTISPTPGDSSPKPDLDEIQSKISEYESKINELRGEAKSLSSQIKIVDSQIALTELRVDETEKKLENLKEDIEITESKITNLEGNIEGISKALLNRIVATYKFGSVEPWQVLLTSGNIDSFFTRLRYLKIVQEYDQKNIIAAEQSKVSYSNQQDILIEKEKEAEQLYEQLDSYNEQLSSERGSKEALLKDTQGSEARYQNLLAEAKAEYEAIQGIIAGRGTEGEVGSVNQGDTIASIIQGASCNSSGTHLHFTVSKNGLTENPFGYLGNIEVSNQSNGDEFNPSGSWEWPISGPIKFNQGYGQTWYVRTYHFYPSHNGIDISGSSLSVRAVKSGTLFQGSYTGTGGCRLRYVRVHHDEDGIDTFYLHVNYVN